MLSVRELFKVGHGPSSSHTIGPMRACRWILEHFESKGIDHIKIIMYGSFALTGKGHLSDKAMKEVFAKYPVEIVWDIKTPTPHPNTMDVLVYDKAGKLLTNQRFVSVGGGTIEIEGQPKQANVYPYKNFYEMKKIIKDKKLTAFQFLCQHEDKQDLINLFEEMIKSFEDTCADGLSKTGQIEGLVAFDRRARTVMDSVKPTDDEMVKRVKKVAAWGMATNEEAVGYGMVVTAPTCGSAGVMPGAYMWAKEKYKPTKERIYEALSAASLVGITVKQNGSVAGATGGCQAEVGVAVALAATMYSVLAFDSKIDEWEMAAEHGLEQLLGMTCDAVGQCAYVPCIQRNGLYAIKAIDSAEVAHQLGDFRSLIYLDDAIAVLKKSGDDLNDGYKETSKLGLAKHCKYVLKFRKNIQFDENGNAAKD